MNNKKGYADDCKDIAHWLTVSMLQLGRAPSAVTLQTKYGMSHATAYRWQAWAREKMSAIRAMQIKNHITNTRNAA